ncbi:hypothetical protein [Chryseobacterium hagamense]|uniref:Uncharacterized protein n=1 Tax=Chryseobacterium hagamense TaxID=395935 RepID=A0A511YMZ2_9FLAO|nr:hypothetical protein [Chryseobacterium hagamense]GEN76569.1 hypothetical protein CHA01nite_23090 [Chryseobacterium hagamense]
MKKIIFFILVLSNLIFAQETKNIKAIDSIITLKKIKFDSLNLKSSEVETQLIKIDYCKIFFNKIILNDNYKNKKRLSEIIHEFQLYLPDQYSYIKLYNNKNDILTLRNAILFSEKYSLLKMYRKFINGWYENEITKEENKINNIENRISYLLFKGNINIEDYNKLSKEDQNKLLIELEEKY